MIDPNTLRVEFWHKKNCLQWRRKEKHRTFFDTPKKEKLTKHFSN